MTHWFNWKSRLASKGGASMEQPESLVAGQTGFALNLYRQLKENSGNLFFSPLSVSTCLAMAYAGARGNTAKEMSRALGFASDQDRFHAAFGELLRQINDMAIPLVANFQAGADGRPHSLQQLPGLQLDLANELWAQKGYQFLEAFLKIVEREYRGDVRQANFTTECAAVISAVNQWIAEKTHDKI